MRLTYSTASLARDRVGRGEAGNALIGTNAGRVRTGLGEDRDGRGDADLSDGILPWGGVQRGERCEETTTSAREPRDSRPGLAEMLKGGVIMDVVNDEHAKIAEEAGATCR